MRPLLLGATALAVLLPAASASAGTLTREGDTLVFRAAPGEANDLFVNDESPEFAFNDSQPITIAASGCEGAGPDFPTIVRCAPSAAVRVELNDGDDVFRVGSNWRAAVPIAVDGGAGNDRLEGGAEADTFAGGDGDDTLKGGDGDDTLDGGAGRDNLEGGAGRDVVRGGDGDDTLSGDPGASLSADVIDGGPGRDTLSEYEYNDGTSQRPVHITLDAGGADDGRPGEGDEIIGVEVVHLLVAADMTAGPGGSDLKVFHTLAAPSRLIGGPGNDTLTGFDYDDVIDGGAGDDTLIGGYGHDTITGGPGRDTINADAVDGCNFLECRPIYGNDTIYVRDGEVDTVTCGPGTDTVVADPIDVIAPDCENVDRGVVSNPKPDGGKTPGQKPGGKSSKLSVSLPKTLSARALKKAGRTLKVTAPGRGKIALTLARGKAGKGGTAATGGATAKAAGTVSVSLRARNAKQRRLVRKGTYRLLVRWTPSSKGAKSKQLTKTIKVG